MQEELIKSIKSSKSRSPQMMKDSLRDSGTLSNKKRSESAKMKGVLFSKSLFDENSKKNVEKVNKIIEKTARGVNLNKHDKELKRKNSKEYERKELEYDNQNLTKFKKVDNSNNDKNDKILDRSSERKKENLIIIENIKEAVIHKESMPKEII